MQKTYTKLEIVALLIIVCSAVIVLFCAVMLIEDFDAIFFFPLAVTLGLSALLCFFYKRLGFGSDRLPPNIFSAGNLSYDKIKDKLSSYFHGDMIPLETDRASFLLTKKNGLDLRIFLLRMDDFNQSTYMEVKARSNEKINHDNSIGQKIPLSEAGRKIRINFVVMISCNEYSTDLSWQNANFLFSRAEAVLNVFLYEEEGILCVPAHFGLSCFNKYYKAYQMIEQSVSAKEPCRQ